MVETTELAPMLTGVVSSTVTMIVVSLATQNVAPVPAYIREVMDEAGTVGPIPGRLLAATDTSLGPEASAIDKAMNRSSRND